ncbi:MAG: Tex family protein [Eubacteriales bacterium]|nr:Tex family protein [Eubacteriales bacterium]
MMSKQIATVLGVREAQVAAAIRLLDEGNTIPFIARYRKEMTGSLTDEQLRTLGEQLEYMRNLEARKETVLKTIREQGELTVQLETKIRAAQTLVAVEDLYLPYKPKRRTRAMMAKEKGLVGLAELLLQAKADRSVAEAAEKYICEKNLSLTVEEALQGAADIIAEQMAETAQLRSFVREYTWKNGHLQVSAKDEAVSSVYEHYYQFESPIGKLSGYQVLAINRGEKEKMLQVKLTVDEEKLLTLLCKRFARPEAGTTGAAADWIRAAVTDGYKRLLAPAVERDIRSELTETASDGAIKVLGKNLHQLLMQAPIADRVVLGWDPAFRTGCKLAVVDETGKVLATTVVYPTAPTTAAKIRAAKDEVIGLIRRFSISLIALGNGTASRESEQIIVEILQEIPEQVSYVIVNEAGASVYSASKLATEEFPQFDVGQRSATSIARRLQDPLAELVKIDPKSIGVGQYQHDMNQKKLEESLHAVVEECVNAVGVDLNTASASLLEHVAGISKTLGKNIVSYREEHGSFRSRKELLKVDKLGPKAFEQCAGFLRIRGGKDALDNTGIHPESYTAAQALLQHLGLKDPAAAQGIRHQLKGQDMKRLATTLGIGAETLQDMVAELEKPGRDPRSEMPKPILKTDVLDIKDLRPGMVLQGTVRNVIDFGAFVDIGVHQDGLVHISRLSDRFVKHPQDVVKVGDIVRVKVVEVDPVKKRIGLSMRDCRE